MGMDWGGDASRMTDEVRSMSERTLVSMRALARITTKGRILTTFHNTDKDLVQFDNNIVDNPPISDDLRTHTTHKV